MKPAADFPCGAPQGPIRLPYQADLGPRSAIVVEVAQAVTLGGRGPPSDRTAGDDPLSPAAARIFAGAARQVDLALVPVVSPRFAYPAHSSG